MLPILVFKHGMYLRAYVLPVGILTESQTNALSDHSVLGTCTTAGDAMKLVRVTSPPNTAIGGTHNDLLI